MRVLCDVVHLVVTTTGTLRTAMYSALPRLSRNSLRLRRCVIFDETCGARFSSPRSTLSRYFRSSLRFFASSMTTSISSLVEERGRCFLAQFHDLDLYLVILAQPEKSLSLFPNFLRGLKYRATVTSPQGRSSELHYQAG